VFTAVRQTPLNSLTACTETEAILGMDEGKISNCLTNGPEAYTDSMGKRPIFHFCTIQASDSVMDHRSHGTTLCHQKTILQPAVLHGLYEEIEVVYKTEEEW
jgi:hypothetical protein